MAQNKTEKTSVVTTVRNRHPHSRVQGIAPGEVGEVPTAIFKRFPSLFEKVNLAAEKKSG